MTLTSKERVLSAVSLSGRPDRVPMDFNANPATMKRLMKDFNSSCLRELLPQLHVDIVDIRGVVDPVYRGPDRGGAVGGVREDYRGMRRKLVDTATGPEDCYVDFPLAQADSLEKIEAHRWPEVDWFDFEGFAEALEPWRDFGVMASGASVSQHPMLLCGMDKILTDMALCPELACAVFDKFTDFYLAYYDKMLTAAQGRIDLFRIGDDIGTQRGPLISPAMFRQFIAPRLQVLVDLTHSHDTKVMFHSCGSITAFIDALIEIGIDYFSDAGATTLTIENNTISNNSGGATVGDDIGLTIDQDTSATSTLALTLTDNLIENNGYTGVLLDNASGTFTASLARNSITNNGLYGTYVANRASGVLTVEFYSNRLTENASVGVWLINNTGTLNALFESNVMAMNGGDGLELDNLNGGVFDYDLGGGGLGSAGLNSIFANGSGYDIDNDTATSILAQNNWWGAPLPNPGRFSGAVDYAPYLVSDPN